MLGHMMRMMDKVGPEREALPMVIFVGFRTDAVDAAHAADVQHTVVMAVVLLLVGCTGVLLLFLAQNYRSTRVSLARAEAFSDNLVSRMPIGLVAVDRDGLVTAVNSVAEATLGIRAVGVTGCDVRDVIPAILADTLADANSPVEKEVLCPVADGRRIPMDVSAASLADENGDRFGQVILFKDLTEIRALHQELEKKPAPGIGGAFGCRRGPRDPQPVELDQGLCHLFQRKIPGKRPGSRDRHHPDPGGGPVKPGGGPLVGVFPSHPAPFPTGGAEVVFPGCVQCL